MATILMMYSVAGLRPEMMDGHKHIVGCVRSVGTIKINVPKNDKIEQNTVISLIFICLT